MASGLGEKKTVAYSSINWLNGRVQIIIIFFLMKAQMHLWSSAQVYK